MCSDAPESDPMVGQAAMANANIAKEALEYYKGKDAANAPRQAKMDEAALALADQQLATSKFNDEAGRAMLDRYQKVGVPAEDAMYRDAAEYDNKARREQAAGQAATDVDVAMAGAMDAKRRTMARAGVNPADGRALSLEQDGATAGALAKATAMDGARNRVKEMGVMLRKDAANFAKGMSSNAAQTFGTAGAQGAGATGALAGAIGTANASTQANGAGFGTAISGNNSSASILNQERSLDLQASSQSGLMAGVSGIAQGIGAAGGVAKFFSDENMKQDVQPVDEDAALDGIANTDVKAWQYKPGSAGDDGGQQHIGAMAQDMQKNLGDTVAPGGKVVDVVSAIGVNMAATKALAKKVDGLQKIIAKQGVKHG